MASLPMPFLGRSWSLSFLSGLKNETSRTRHDVTNPPTEYHQHVIILWQRLPG